MTRVARQSGSGLCCVLLALASLLRPAASAASAEPQASGEVVVAEGTSITILLNDHLSTRFSNEGDRFTAAVSAPVMQGDRVVVPKGSLVMGTVGRVLRPGRFRGKAEMNLLFQQIRIPGRGESQLVATLFRVHGEGEAEVRGEGKLEGSGTRGRDSTRVLAPTASGAGIGGLAGGGKGAAIGAGVGAAVGLATVFATRGKDLEVARGCVMEIRLERPITLPAESDAPNIRNR